MHEHEFTRHVPRKIAGGKFTAWVDERFIYASPYQPVDEMQWMWRCACGEQGYEVPA